MWRRTCRSMAILAQTRISSGSSGQSRHRPRSRVMGAKELIGLLSNELRSGEHGLARIEPILFAASQLPEIIECGLPTPARVRAGLRSAASRNGELPSSRPPAWLILERDFLEIRFFTPSPFACWTPQGQLGPLWEESQRAGCHARRLGSHARTERYHGSPPSGLRLPCASRQHQCQTSNAAGRTGTLPSGGTCAATSLFRMVLSQLGVRVPCVSPL